MSESSEKIVEHLFRLEYGKLVSILTRFFGASQIQIAEDIVQDTLITALSNWAVKGIPDNPSAWLVQVSKRKALNELKRNKMMSDHASAIGDASDSYSVLDEVFLPSEIEDSLLRMIFTCCNPALSQESQIALTLKTLCGFGVIEVSSALLTSESNINKRLYRAKKALRNSDFVIPQGADLEIRLETVLLTLYLLFNEGYNSSSSNEIIRKELCLEAIRLTKLLENRFVENSNIKALIALMTFHTARFNARIDDHGAIVLFENQDRDLWDKELIGLGRQYLGQARREMTLSVYHLEASIAEMHCVARSFESTDWKSIYSFYSLLYALKPNPIIQLNLAIVQSQIDGIASSLDQLQALSQEVTLREYHLLPATQGIFNMKLGRYEEALDYLLRALSLQSKGPENVFIQTKIDECKKKLSSTGAES